MTEIIECPICGAQNNTTDWVESWSFDGDTFEVECRDCDEQLNIKVSVTIDYDLIGKNK